MVRAMKSVRSAPAWAANPSATPAAERTPRNRLVRTSDADHTPPSAIISTLCSAVNARAATCRSSADTGLGKGSLGSAASSGNGSCSIGLILSRPDGQQVVENQPEGVDAQ